MAFVNEKISDADKTKYDAFQFKSPFNRKPESAWKWTIDRERDVFLVSLGGQGMPQSEIPAFYALVWKGNVIRFDAFIKGKGDYQSGNELWWNILNLRIPQNLEPRREDVLQLLREAIDAHGLEFHRDRIIAIHIGIEPETAFKVE